MVLLTVCKVVQIGRPLIIHNDEQKEKLETGRRKERRLLWEMNKFVKDLLHYDPEVDIYVGMASSLLGLAATSNGKTWRRTWKSWDFRGCHVA